MGLRKPREGIDWDEERPAEPRGNWEGLKRKSEENRRDIFCSHCSGGYDSVQWEFENPMKDLIETKRALLDLGELRGCKEEEWRNQKEDFFSLTVVVVMTEYNGNSKITWKIWLRRRETCRTLGNWEGLKRKNEKNRRFFSCRILNTSGGGGYDSVQ